MSKADNAKCSNFFEIAFLILFIPLCAPAPVSVTENAYTQFISELIRNQCSVPSQVHLPFDTTKVNNFDYLSSSLEICQKTESIKRNKEAVVLCKEIFDNIRNISCPKQTALPDNISVSLSPNVCPDIGALKESVPEDDKSLLKRLTDTFLCDIMCDSDFEKACQVLLWSFQVRKQIASVASAQETKEPIVAGVGKDTNVDTLKQENMVEGNAFPGIGLNPEKEKLSAEGAKDINEGVGPHGVPEAPESGKLEDNLGKISDAAENPAPNGKESTSENRAVSNQDSTDVTQSASSVKTLSSVAQHSPLLGVRVFSSKGETKAAEEVAPNQLPKDVTKKDEADAGGEFPRVSDEQTQDLNRNVPADGVDQDIKEADIPAGVLVPDNSTILATQNAPIDGEDMSPSNEIPDETPEKGDEVSPIHNDLPHESANEETPNDAPADLHDDGKNLSTVDQNKLQSPATDSLSKKTDSSTTNGQTITDATKQQTIQETTLGKTSVTRVETKADQSQINFVAPKEEETQEHSKTANNLVTNDANKDLSMEPKKANVAQQTEEFSNAIPDATQGPIVIDEKPSAKSQKTEPTAANPDGKSVFPSSLLETSTKATVALEKMEGGSDLRQPSDEGADHYDMENPGDEYPVSDYGDAFGENPANKPLEPKPPIPAAKEVVASQNARPMEFPSRNAFGQDTLLISPFPEQEDSHFFFYFLSIVLIMMAGYLIFHNKQKIIALIVEGRHERNRRSHRIGYKKLETK